MKRRFGSKGEEDTTTLHNKDSHNLYSSSDITNSMKRCPS
jgi:hypothetical protein